jgi:pimeloyl-ACP methyl ester carboxylesterase
VPYGCGEDTARRIPGAKLVGIDGMGHDLPPEPVTQILAAMVPHLNAATPKAA